MNYHLTIIALIILCSFKITFAQDPSLDEINQMVSSPIDTARIDGLNELSWYYKYSKPDTAFFFGHKALDASEEINYAFGKAKAYNNMAIVFWGQGKYDSAISYLKEARFFFEELGNEKGICANLINASILKQNTGDIPGSLDDLFEALRLQKKLKIDAYLGPILSNIGNAYSYQYDYQNAKIWHLKSYKDKLKKGVGVLYISEMNLGVSYQKLGDADSALLFYNKALVGAKEAESWMQLQEIYLDIGSIYSEAGDYKRALINYQKAEELVNLSNHLLDATILYSRLAEIHRILKNYNEARRYGDLSLKTAIELGNNLNISASYQELYKIASDAGEIQDALDYHILYVQYQDSVFTIEKESTIADIVSKYELETKDQEIKTLAAESELQALQIAQSKWIIVGVIILSVFLISGLILNNSRRRYRLKAVLAEEKERIQKNRFKAVIEAEEKERKRIAQELHDGLGQILSTARLSISSLDEDEKSKSIQHSLKLIDSAVDETRSISHNLMPNALVAIGLEAALKDLIRNINHSKSLKATILMDEFEDVGESVSLAIYRIVQETINNAIKYAEASNLSLRIKSGNELIIEVADDGKGFDTTNIEKSEGIGWKNIYSRAEIINGNVSVYSKLGEGTNVKITLPINESAQATAS